MIDPSAYPHLARFFRGYLHEDFVAEHGSAPKALAAFRADLSPADRAALDTECTHMGEALQRVPFAEIRRLIGEGFRSAWNPAARAEVMALLRG